jgi:hypothetical protein
LSAVIAWSAAPVLRPPQPIMPKRITSLPPAYARTFNAPRAAADATVLEAFRKSRRVVPLVVLDAFDRAILPPFR